jgi:hypothetical protein
MLGPGDVSLLAGLEQAAGQQAAMSEHSEQYNF